MKAVIAALAVAVGLAWSIGPLLAQDVSGENRSGPSAAVQQKAPAPGPGTNAREAIGGGAIPPDTSGDHDGTAGAGRDRIPTEPDTVAPPPPVNNSGTSRSGPYIRGGIGGGL